MKCSKDYSGMDECEVEQFSSQEKRDCVFWEKHDNIIAVKNEADNYRFDMELGERYETVVVCTMFDGRITIELWLGLPDSINQNQYVKWLAQGEEKEYCVRLKFW